MSRKVAIQSLFALLLGVAACCANAEENRYMHLIEGGVVYRFDNLNGEVYRLVKSQSGQAMWVKCDVVEPKGIAKAPTPLPIPLLNITQQTTPTVTPRANCVAPFPSTEQLQPVATRSAASMLDADSATEPAPKKVSANRIELFDELDRNITDAIDENMRQQSRAAINAYSEKLNISSTLKINGDKITGMIMLNNKGDRAIERMELTMYLRVYGNEKPIEHQRFIFAAHGSADVPPAPSSGASSLSVLKKIDLPTPSGVIQGMPEVRVTYLKFEDQQ
ncbi:MAG TPA: hypothetical protein VKX17_15565 [Planctomycetota bacterium]|nr:hypothetical protein [Planctomycetota bacterium]